MQMGLSERFLAVATTRPTEWTQVRDILDVWFDSGSTHAFCLEQREDLKWPADLYLEGSDQHRGWFHSSLLESCGTRGRAPYDAVLTHGFTMDEHGRKMSKSLNNSTAPQDVIKQYGADILRLWVASVDYAEDQRIGPEIIKTNVDAYRKLRNTLRWMLGSLAHFKPEDKVPDTDMPELERLMLSHLARLDGVVRNGYDEFDFRRIYSALSNFMTTDLSSFYFDVRKDALYCDAPSSMFSGGLHSPLSTEFLTASYLGWRRFWCSPVTRPGHSATVTSRLRSHGSVSRRCRQDWRDQRSRSQVGEDHEGAVRCDRRAGNRTSRKAHRLVPGVCSCCLYSR